MNRGWTCPNCGGCYSPATPQCFNCTGRTSTSGGCELRGPHLSHNSVPPHLYNEPHVYMELDDDGKVTLGKKGQYAPEGWPVVWKSKEEMLEQFPDKQNDTNEQT